MTCKNENCCSDSGAQRKPGFYWVRCKEYKTAIYEGWAVREWAASEKHGIWVDIQCVEDDHWLEIDERRIERPPICKSQSGIITGIIRTT